MPRTKRLLFERLTWKKDGTRTAPHAATADEEATAVLLALGGYKCDECHGFLSEGQGYTCCHRAYCPYCGRYTHFYSRNVNKMCPHHVLSFARHRWTPQFFTVFHQVRHEAAPVKDNFDNIYFGWLALIQPVRPALRLPDQKVNGFPRWTDQQLADAYTPDVLPHLEAFFGPNLREFRTARLGPALRSVLRPDIKTAVSDDYYHWEDNYFAADPRQALAHAEIFLQNLQAGT